MATARRADAGASNARQGQKPSGARDFAQLLLAARPQLEPGLSPAPARPAAAHAPSGAALDGEASRLGARHRQQGEQADDDSAAERAALRRSPGEHEPTDTSWSVRAAQWAPPLASQQEQAQQHVEHTVRRGDVEQLAPQLLRQFAWRGDGDRGSARLVLGDGALAGAVLTLHSEGKQVRLEASGLADDELLRLRSQLQRGLGARGFELCDD